MTLLKERYAEMEKGVQEMGERLSLCIRAEAMAGLEGGAGDDATARLRDLEVTNSARERWKRVYRLMRTARKSRSQPIFTPEKILHIDLRMLNGHDPTTR